MSREFPVHVAKPVRNGKENGNVLFLILICVALFAALSYAVTSSTRGSAGSPSREKVEMHVARLFSFMAKLDAAVLRITMNYGVGVHQIIYTTPVYKLTTGAAKVTSPAISSNPSLALFHPAVNGIPPETFEDICTDSVVSGTRPGHLGFSWLSIPGLGSDAADATANVVGLPQEVCQKINEKSGISIIPDFISGTGSANLPGSSGPPASQPISMSPAQRALISGAYDFCGRLPDGRLLYFHIYKVN